MLLCGGYSRRFEKRVGDHIFVVWSYVENCQTVMQRVGFARDADLGGFGMTGRRLVCYVVCFLLSFGAVAQPVDLFETAVTAWLDGDDESSLPWLAGLAASGNADARLLLARIETEDLGHSNFRLSLTPEEARAVFRQESEGFFGPSWLAVEADAGNEMAIALKAAQHSEPHLDVIDYLARNGERQATDHATRIVALYGDDAMKAELAESPHLLAELRPYLAYLSGPEEPRGDGLAALRHIAPGDVMGLTPNDAETIGMAGYLALGLGFGDSSANNVHRPTVEDWLMSASSMRPIANLCRRSCAAEAPQCAFAFLGLSGGYYEAIRYDSPYEKIIPQDVFLNSARAEMMVLRRAVLARTETNLSWLSEMPELREISACAARLTEETRAASK